MADDLKTSFFAGWAKGTAIAVVLLLIFAGTEDWFKRTFLSPEIEVLKADGPSKYKGSKEDCIKDFTKAGMEPKACDQFEYSK